MPINVFDENLLTLLNTSIPPLPVLHSVLFSWPTFPKNISGQTGSQRWAIRVGGTDTFQAECSSCHQPTVSKR